MNLSEIVFGHASSHWTFGSLALFPNQISQCRRGNVYIEAFASVLASCSQSQMPRSIDSSVNLSPEDRICRRADASADIFRRFVDLGSGRGMAV